MDQNSDNVSAIKIFKESLSVKRLKILILITLFIVSFLFLSCKENSEINSPPIEQITLSADITNPTPYQFITITVHGMNITLDKYSGKLGEKSIVAVRKEDNQLSLMIPNVSPGKQTLTISFEKSQESIDLIIQQRPSINSDAVNNQFVADINNILNSLDSTVSATNRLTVNNLVNDFNDEFSKLTDSEKVEFAYFITNNFNFSNLPLSFAEEENPLVGFNTFLKFQITKIVFAGVALKTLLAAPEGVFTKIAAFASAVIIAESILEVGTRAIEIYQVATIPLESDLSGLQIPTGPTLDRLLKATASLELINNQEYSFDVIVKYRTIYSGDIGTTNPILSSIVENLDIFQTWWNKTNDALVELKNLFGYTGDVLKNRPKSLSDISTFQTAEFIGTSQNALILDITNPNISVTQDNIGEQLRVTFSSEETSDQDFSFTLKYTEAEFTVDTTYEATLINSRFGSFTDTRDGHTYRTIEIAGKIWLANNLNYYTETSFRNPDATEIEGRLYTWYEAQTVCPPGWHLPSATEYQSLINAVNGDPKALKDENYTLSDFSYDGSNNSSGFSALAAGWFLQIYDNITNTSYYTARTHYASFWSSSDSDEDYPNYNLDQAKNFTIGIWAGRERAEVTVNSKIYGLSVRCIKD